MKTQLMARRPKKVRRNGSAKPGFASHGLEPMLSSNEVMALLGYRDRGSFWETVYARGIPHVRFNPRVIRFPQAELGAWLARNGNTSR